jgi:hypothetical protein
MNYETVTVLENRSGKVSISHVILSVRNTLSDGCQVVIGYPGLTNLEKRFRLGDAVLFETPDGILEIRAIRLSSADAEFQVTELSPRPGFAGALLSDDPTNLPFSEPELARIVASVTDVKASLATSEKFTREQLSLVSRKLDEIQAGAEKFGRKDWVNWVAGTLTGLCVTAAFAPDQAKVLFNAIGAAFSWALNNAPLLLR